MFVTGLGVVTCAGVGVDSLWQSTLNSRTGIGPEGLGRVESVVGEDRALRFCLQAAREAIEQAGWDQLSSDDGLILATTTGQFLKWESHFIEYIGGRLSNESFRAAFQHQPLGSLATALQSELNFSGPYTVVTSACTAATQALALGSMWLKAGRVKRVLVGGVEVLCRLTCEGFRSLQLLSSEPARPFDMTRKGINLSEGAGFLCMENQSSDRVLARVSGLGFSTDGFHMTSPHPEGSGSLRAMKQALSRAGLKASEIPWVHAHGTGSLHNDLSEAAAIKRLYDGEELPLVSSTKWLHGHALGASGAIESALVIRAMNEGRVLYTRGLTKWDPALGLREFSEDVQQPLRHVLKNTLGFGGTNAAVVLSC